MSEVGETFRIQSLNQSFLDGASVLGLKRGGSGSCRLVGAEMLGLWDLPPGLCMAFHLALPGSCPLNEFWKNY